MILCLMRVHNLTILKKKNKKKQLTGLKIIKKGVNLKKKIKLIMLQSQIKNYKKNKKEQYIMSQKGILYILIIFISDSSEGASD